MRNEFQGMQVRMGGYLSSHPKFRTSHIRLQQDCVVYPQPHPETSDNEPLGANDSVSQVFYLPPLPIPTDR